MDEKSREIWEVSLASLQDHRKIGTVGVRCNACAHRHSWPIEELIARHKPWVLVSDLWKGLEVQRRNLRMGRFMGERDRKVLSILL